MYGDEVKSGSLLPRAVKVLVVDDELSVATVAKRMLEKLGQHVSLAESGEQAVEIFSREKDFDWVLMDITMPGIDGLACLQLLRGINPEVRVVMTSGYDATSALNDTQTEQPDGFLRKPYTFAALREVAEIAVTD